MEMNRDSFIEFYTDILDKFPLYFKDLMERKFKKEYLRYFKISKFNEYWNSSPDEREEKRKQNYQEALGGFMAVLNKNSEYMDFCKNKFELEMNLIVSILDNNGEVFISEYEDNDINLNALLFEKYDSQEIDECFRGKYSYLLYNELPMFIFSQNSMNEINKIVENAYPYKLIQGFEDISKQNLNALRNHMGNMLNSTMEIENILKIEYAEYFNSYFKQYAQNESVTVTDFKNFDKRQAYIYDEIYQNLQEKIINLRTQIWLDLYESNKTENSFLSHYSMNYMTINDLIVKTWRNSPIGDGSEMRALFRINVFNKDEKIIENYIESNNIDELMEEYNYFTFDTPKNISSLQIACPENNSYFHKYWQDKDLLQRLEIINKIVSSDCVNIEDKQLIFRDGLNFLKNKYIVESKEIEFLKQIKVFENAILNTVLSFNSEDEVNSYFIDSKMDMLEQKKLYIFFNGVFVKSKAQKEGMSVFDYLTSKETIITKVFTLNNILIAFEDLFNTNDSYQLMKRIEGSSFRSLYKEGIDITINKDENFIKSYIVITINTDKIKKAEDKLMNLFYEEILKDFVVGNICDEKERNGRKINHVPMSNEYVREKILKHEMRIMDKNNSKNSNVIKKKI